MNQFIINCLDCGDGKRTLPEECDDGNTIDGDGCDSNCFVEINYICQTGDYTNELTDVCEIEEFCGKLSAF
jgi:cysteine-rich repeat protein